MGNCGVVKWWILGMFRVGVRDDGKNSKNGIKNSEIKEKTFGIRKVCYFGMYVHFYPLYINNYSSLLTSRKIHIYFQSI